MTTRRGQRLGQPRLRARPTRALRPGRLDDIGDRLYRAATLTRLGDAQHAAGTGERAGDAWKQALSTFDDLDHPAAAEVQAKLQRLRHH